MCCLYRVVVKKSLVIILLIIAFVGGTLVSASTASAEKGGPFAEIWAAIFGLQDEVDDLEKRIEALEDPQNAPPPIVSEVIIPSGTSVPGCETNNECYLPYKAGVMVGDELTWTNTDSAAHTVTSGSANEGPSGEFNSSLVFAGESFSHTFNSVGEVPYFCMVHPWMEGIVVVLDET